MDSFQNERVPRAIRSDRPLALVVIADALNHASRVVDDRQPLPTVVQQANEVTDHVLDTIGRSHRVGIRANDQNPARLEHRPGGKLEGNSLDERVPRDVLRGRGVVRHLDKFEVLAGRRPVVDLGDDESMELCGQAQREECEEKRERLGRGARKSQPDSLFLSSDTTS